MKCFLALWVVYKFFSVSLMAQNLSFNSDMNSLNQVRRAELDHYDELIECCYYTVGLAKVFDQERIIVLPSESFQKLTYRKAVKFLKEFESLEEAGFFALFLEVIMGGCGYIYELLQGEHSLILY